jgi:hypothetical protein
MLFTLQFKHNPAYRVCCEARGVNPGAVNHWTQIPALPTAAFKELELTCLPVAERSRVFHSSGTTGQPSSRHFHNADSLAVYEASLWAWFEANCLTPRTEYDLVCLTPEPEVAPHSSLAHMFDAVRRRLGQGAAVFVAKAADDGGWAVQVAAAVSALQPANGRPKLVLGAAFSFVQLADALVARQARLKLPAGSKVLETGGYKGRSRAMPKDELHGLLVRQFGVTADHIITEYGMSELSSQAYSVPRRKAEDGAQTEGRAFHFPAWARGRVISPETGREVGEGETGLVQVFDLANVYSVLAIQTEDLAIRRGAGFELLGRAPQAEPRGCSLLVKES